MNNKKIEIEFERKSAEYPYLIRVQGTYAGQPFTGTLWDKSDFGYHVRLDYNPNGANVYCPEKKFRLAQITLAPFARADYNIEFVSKDKVTF
jgi:hypothetical protein